MPDPWPSPLTVPTTSDPLGPTTGASTGQPPPVPGAAGFSPEKGLWRLLQLKGHEGSFQVFRETHPLDGDLESMTGPLEREGIQARLVLVQPEDLRFLELPTLLQFRDGSWALLRAATRTGWRLETPRGHTILGTEDLARDFSGHALDLSHPLGSGSLWACLRRQAVQHRAGLVQVFLASLGLQALGLAGPLITGVVLSRALPDGAGSLLELVALLIALTALFQAWLSWFRGRSLLFLVNRIQVAAERGFLAHLLRLPFAYLQTTTTGELLQAFGGLSAAREVILEKALGTLLDGVMATVYLVAMAWILPLPTVAVLLATAVMAGAVLLSGRFEARLEAQGVALQARERGYLSELLAGIGTLKAAGAERLAHRRWCRAWRAELSLGLRQGRIRLWTDAGVGLVSQAVSVLLLVWGGHMALNRVLPVGTLFAFLQLSSAFNSAVLGLVDTCLHLVVVGPQLARTRTILAQAPEPAPPLITGSEAAAVLLEDVWFRYTAEGPWILSGYNLRVKAGEKRMLQDASGSGKTTVLRLLAGLLTPEKGTVTIDGLRPQAAHQRILYLPQFVQILAGTVLDNLRVLSAGAPREALLEASRRTGLDAFLTTLPMGYHTVLPNGGRSLSGGQRQLIAVTAALASRRPLLLLDEAMASIDVVRSTELAQVFNAMPQTIISAQHFVTGPE